MNEVAKFLAERGDYTLRLNYNLDKDSIVIDAGGYKGWFAENIYNNYGEKKHTRKIQLTFKNHFL